MVQYVANLGEVKFENITFCDEFDPETVKNILSLL